jgi:hypothetical protein
MHDFSASFLRSLYATSVLSHRVELTSREVNDLAVRVGIPAEAVLPIVEHLKTEGFIEVHWGDRLSLTVAGRERATGERSPESAGSINLGPNAIYAPNSTGPVGHGAGSTGSTISVGGVAVGREAALLTAAVGDLAALLHALRKVEGTPGEPLEAQELRQEVQATLETVQNPAARGDFRHHTGRLRDLLARFGDVAVWGERGYAIVELGRLVVEHLGKLLPSI